MASIKSLWHREYETISAVNDISFQIKEGEAVGFIGQNGAGKTTTLKILSGLLYPTSGEVKVMGFNPWDRNNQYRQRMALIMGQKSQLWWDLPAIETFDLNRVIYEIPMKQYQETLDQLCELLQVKDIINIQVRRLSLGQRMKCELIAALLHRPKVLFLDEPTIGLDVVMQKVMRDFIKQYNRQYNSTIMLTSHYMGDVKDICNRVIVINQGKKMYDGSLNDIINKYARNKKLSLILKKKVSIQLLEKYGTVKNYDYPTATIFVPRDKASIVTGRLFKEIAIEDVNIEEIPIESVIRELYKQK